MNASFVVCVLAVLAGAFGSVARAPATRVNLNVGYIGYGDRLLYRQQLYTQGIYNAIQYQDFIYRGNATVRITAIQAYEVGYTQFGFPQILAGGVGFNYTTVRVTSARSYGYNYLIDLWGR